MIANFDQAPVELGPALFLRIVDGAGTSVTCLDGCLWVTRDGCPKDVMLAPGESYLVEGATRVIVSAFGPSLARVRPAALQDRPARTQLLASFLRGLRLPSAASLTPRANG